MRNQTEIKKLRAILLDEFAARRERNTSYSLRAFARDVGVNVTSLSEFFSNRRQLSPRTRQAVAERLGIPHFALEKTISTEPQSEADDSLQLEEDTFHTISDWYHYGILSLARLKRNKADPKWIAGRLGISIVTARGALERLTRLNLIRRVGNRLYRTQQKITTTNNVPSQAVRHYHKKNLQLAQETLDAEPLERRFETAITMPTDPKKLERAGQLIARFREELADFLEAGDTTEVYTLMIHLFPLTKRKKGLCDN